jgi:enamine deaminase RidA (YjgF/YER057c/UK114 family)
MNRTALNSPDAPSDDAGYSPGILAEGKKLIVISGQGPKDLRLHLPATDGTADVRRIELRP